MKMIFKIFITFFKIGAFSFGGGYAMISMIEKEIVEINNWLTSDQLIDIIGVAEMTPGPIAINSSTFVGYRVAGFFGALAGTVGVILVSFFLITLLSKHVDKAMTKEWFKGVLKGIRPGIVGLILAAALSIGKSAIIDFKSVIILCVVLYMIVKKKFHPIICIVVSALFGILLY